MNRQKATERIQKRGRFRPLQAERPGRESERGIPQRGRTQGLRGACSPFCGGTNVFGNTAELFPPAGRLRHFFTERNGKKSMNGNKPDKTKHQKGISCAVCSCAYHDGDCYAAPTRFRSAPRPPAPAARRSAPPSANARSKAVRSSGRALSPFGGDGRLESGRASAPRDVGRMFPREKRSILCAGWRFGLWAEPRPF